MPEMEKGRPPENKRSRKPAHPVKREINQEMKTFAESTMNELLGWYGYDKVDLRDSEANEIRNYRERRQHVSVLKENSLPKPKSLDAKVSQTVLTMKSGEREPPSVPSSSSPSSSSTSSSLTAPKEHKSAPVIVPLIKPSAVEDVQNVQIVCVWCQKEGVKRYSLCMGSELKSFCSEKCFAACRRAYFKRNKARDEDLHGERSPQHPHTEDSPRLVLKINTNVRVCDWCKHVRHTKEYLDFGSGEERLQFCSTKCLNQYKMDVFYREARAALTSTSSSPSRTSQEGRVESTVAGQKLLTPESWNSNNSTGETRNRNLSPKGPTLIHGSAESSSISPSEASSSSSSSRVPVSGLRTLERSIQPPPPPPTVEILPHPAPNPPQPCPPLEQKPVPQIPIPFIRPPLHAQGLKSPLANPIRHPGPPSSPIHRPPHSPHLQPPSASSMNPPGLMHPFPGAYFPGLHSPPLNMMPRGPVPMPPMMNFGFPSFSPLLPQPTVLVPYPIIVPLPVPIPIPIPIPVPPKATPETPSHSGVIQPVPEGVDRGRSRIARPASPGISEGDGRLVAKHLGRTFPQSLSSPSDPTPRDTDWVKSERPFLSPVSTPQSGASSPRAHFNESPCSDPGLEGLINYKQQHTERQVIQRVLQRTQVKLEPSANGVVDLSGLGDSGTGQVNRSGLHDIIRPTPPLSLSPPHDTVYQCQDSRTPPSCTPPSPIRSSHSHDAIPSALKSQDHGQNGMSSSSTPASPDSSIPQRLPAPPPDLALNELEAIKENKCSVVSPVRVEGPVSQLEEPLTVDVGEDSHVPDEDHAYALPTAPKTGGTTTPLLLPKLRDKGSLRSPANVPGAGDMEPALKRRCLRIRDQNK
ncbi:sine oculis-binding protein homolog isoform X2 [Mugil cephalus]|uniref:sine oculis-binding protein homolog isoform X2 n=1 Tax=Mugil cephalus TaxID=48193 RepID=UPI001FB7FFF8|nr:sine oculis-binding protein homolog isoform X2 [Mugil cephalus]